MGGEVSGFAMGERTAQEGRERQGKRGDRGDHTQLFLCWWDFFLLRLTGLPFLFYLGAVSLRSRALWAPCALTTRGAAPQGGWQDTLSLVMEQGPILSPSPSLAPPSILT